MAMQGFEPWIFGQFGYTMVTVGKNLMLYFGIIDEIRNYSENE